ncbi:MAG: hypothetical protein XU09_C0004G0205 [Thaumarchaeota archaeon CSP1-1]|nr:MAG: hypothetical protein XU09_C0004G0205 [Thaumarchaeota archaeon CSP1-1]
MIIIFPPYIKSKKVKMSLVQVRGFVGTSDAIETDINKWIDSESPDKILDIKLVEITKTILKEPEFFALVLYQNP